MFYYFYILIYFIIPILHNVFIIKYVTGGQVVYGKALDMMVELLKNTKEEKIMLALLSWFKTISELEDEREVKINFKIYRLINNLTKYVIYLLYSEFIPEIIIFSNI